MNELPNKCPHCGLINPSSALFCDCGYNFSKLAMIPSLTFAEVMYSPKSSQIKVKRMPIMGKALAIFGFIIGFLTYDYIKVHTDWSNIGSILLSAFIWSITGGLVYQFSRKKSSKVTIESAQKVLNSNRCPIVYCRQFTGDMVIIYFGEKKLMKITKKYGSLISFGVPNEISSRSKNKMARFINDSDWHNTYIKIFKHWPIIIINLDNISSHVLWELAIAIDQLDLKRIILILPKDKSLDEILKNTEGLLFEQLVKIRACQRVEFNMNKKFLIELEKRLKEATDVLKSFES